MIFVNVFAGPGSGKTTLAHAVTGKLKMRGSGKVVEYVEEFAKRLVFEGRKSAMANQILVLGHQYQELGNRWGKADIVVTDGPILHGAIYGARLGFPKPFIDLVHWAHFQFPSVNVFVDRPKAFEAAGRLQGREESLEIDEEILSVLEAAGIPLDHRGPPSEETAAEVARIVHEKACAPQPDPKSWFDRERPAAYR